MQIFAIVVSLAIAAVGIALFVKAIREIIAVVKLGQPTAGRTDEPGARTVTLLKETLGHTRMLQWTAVGVGHWFVFIGFGLLFAWRVACLRHKVNAAQLRAYFTPSGRLRSGSSRDRRRAGSSARQSPAGSARRSRRASAFIHLHRHFRSFAAGPNPSPGVIVDMPAETVSPRLEK